MKNLIQNTIEKFIREYETGTATKWGSPLVGFADAAKVAENMPCIMNDHGSPSEAVEDATVVIAYFVPFLKEMADTNTADGMASEEWARAYEETNVMLGKINEHVIDMLKSKGHRAAVHPEAGSFDRDRLVSRWSHRHIAYLAGLGTFGVNNMLITEKGCCGRYSTIVANINVKPDDPRSEQLCGYKKDGSCGACIRKCPSGALTGDGFDRHKCYQICMKNAELYTSFGNSYDDGGETSVGSEVCGKCVAGMPCAFL